MNKLNEQKFLNEINERWKNKNCPMCGHNHWSIDKGMVSPMKLGEDSAIQLGGMIMPLVAVTCAHCGNVVFVNPLIIGAVDTSEKKDK